MNKVDISKFIIPESTEFKWIDFYHKIANGILKYKDSKKELTEIAIQAHQTAGTSTKFLLTKEGKSQDYIDPFTIMSAFNMTIKSEPRKKLQKAYADKLNVLYDLPNSDFLLPNPLNFALNFSRDYENKQIDAPLGAI